MKAILFNLSNHPATTWGDQQTNSAKEIAETIIDLPFPAIDPMADKEGIDALAQHYIDFFLGKEEINHMELGYSIEKLAVHIVGEPRFIFAFVTKAKAIGLDCCASTTRRDAVEENGIKKSIFHFGRFCEY